MNEEYVLIPPDQVKGITLPFIEKHNLTGLDVLNKRECVPVSYKYIIREDPFVEDIVTFEIVFYLGTSYFPRRTSGSQLESTVLSILFTAQVKDKNVLGDKMWDYLYAFERMDMKQLKSINYKTYINHSIPGKSVDDIIKTFNGYKIL